MSSQRVWAIGCVGMVLWLATVWALFTFRYDPWGVIWGYGLVLRYSEADYDESLRRGDQLVAALDRWRAVHGDFPQRIDDLVPAQLESIQRPLVGKGRWAYHRSTPDRFVLEMYVGPAYQSDRFDSDEGRWQIDR